MVFEILHDGGISYADSNCLIAFDKDGCLIIPCSIDEAQYIGCPDTDIFYHDGWMQPEPEGKRFPKATVGKPNAKVELDADIDGSSVIPSADDILQQLRERKLEVYNPNKTAKTG